MSLGVFLTKRSMATSSAGARKGGFDAEKSTSTRSFSAWKALGDSSDAHFSGSPTPLTIFASAKIGFT